MTLRTTQTTVNFDRPFVLGDFDEELPAGNYTVETDEELLQGVSFPVYRRVRVVIHLQRDKHAPGRSRTLTIDPHDLDAALARDSIPLDVLAGDVR
ncbi:MAG: hypothetical protein RLO05_12055 [Rhodospirillales bacterium]|tara:strand:+ start:935 stop:1222 length:288 start_codon:yes stop_codon:yes gene_type:complete